MPILSTKLLCKSVLSAGAPLIILEDINLDIQHGSSTALIGRSGSGKTTLLGLMAGLDQSTSGEIWFDGHPLHALNEDARARLRAFDVGFIFQNFQLLSHLSTLENVMLPMELTGQSDAKNKALQALESVGLQHRLSHKPTLLSGGEQQRVAIARAIAHQPKILFADEPTGNLDVKTGEKIRDLLFSLNQKLGATLVMVTHDLNLAKYCQNEIHIDAGKIVS
jgi:putative ABC transport system ATP-binding protein